MPASTNLDGVLTAIRQLKAEVRAFTYDANSTDAKRQQRALNILGGVEQQLMDACEDGSVPGYFSFIFPSESSAQSAPSAEPAK